MRYPLFGTFMAVAIAGMPLPAAAQTAAPAAQAAPAAPVSVVSAKPTYIAIPLEIAVNKPAADVWKRVGKFCDIGEWLRIPCTITSGKDGEFGAVRSVANEVLVGKTELSYTYTQPVRADRTYNLYHGTLEARPVTATTSKIVYTLFFDNSMMADRCGPARRIGRAERRSSRRRWKTEDPGEGATLPPAPARGRGATLALGTEVPAGTEVRQTDPRRCRTSVPLPHLGPPLSPNWTGQAGCRVSPPAFDLSSGEVVR
jgi:hypothetical protein